MFPCFCCERREGSEIYGGCECTGSWCTTCILCSNHCCCLHSNPTFVNFESEEELEPVDPPSRSSDMPQPPAEHDQIITIAPD